MSLMPRSSARDDLPEALAPDPQTATDFQVTDNCFAFYPGQLNKLFNPKSLPALHALGGLHGLEYGLRTDLNAGLSADETTLPGAVTLEEARQAALSKTESSRKGFGRLLWDAYNDKIIILLTIAAVVSLSLGIYEAKVDRQVRVIRSGRSMMVHMNDLVVGDVVHIGPGDCAPADGVVIMNHGLRCDESMATGESDQIEKDSGDAAADDRDNFIISGSKVPEGLGTYLVTSVGPHSTYGRIMVSLGTESAPTPLQVKLGNLASWIGWFGLGAALLFFFVLLFRFLARLPENDAPSTVKGQEFMDILIVTATVIVVAIPEGLPLAVTLALAFATARTLTQNKMTVAAGFLSTRESFGRLPNASQPQDDIAFIVTQRYPRSRSSGNNTEIALLRLAQTGLVEDVSIERERAQIEQVYPFDSARKTMAVVYRSETGHRLLVKGAAEVVLGGQYTGKSLPLPEPRCGRSELRIASSKAVILGQTGDHEKAALDFDSLFNDLVWIGAFGIHDPLRPEVPEAIQKCHAAGVQVKMVTGDNINTALSIAISSGIKTDDGIAMEGPDFRKLSEGQLNTTVPRLQVLARSSPSDKQLLVQYLKRLGETVAVTGDETNDGPALKAADVGFSMGLSGTEVAREASSIILLDDNFRSIVTAIAWGRCINDAVAKFLQFQITVNITAVCLTVVTAIYSSSNESVFKAVQLLWLNLIMDTFAAPALATEPPTKEILQRPPRPRSAPLFTVTMWKLMLGQSIYKLALCFTLYFAGDKILNYNTEIQQQQLELDTIIFNTFVWMQIFNELNCRQLDNRFNIFQGILENRWFMVLNALMVGGQVLIIFVGGAAFGVTSLDGSQWAICIGCAAFCIPWAAVLKLIPGRHVGMLMSIVSIVLGVLLGPLRKMYRALARSFDGFFRRVHVRDDEEWNVCPAETRVRR
ncbi:putative calcium transporting ATPase (Pmc1) [Aspergillus thermomutatus]|uniref:Calcium-transporting ATPase n=1 Tax=Aspergillus thermomutatus TaxID=41047 RepID=A0A397I1K5_ASPTH|nr:uncharacterized protein CDV56_101880 [Aspergillus thermomutatus]RHZ67304.1 hypothetical protein CDV56_101880 [Aspergillus thermomutatus]